MVTTFVRHLDEWDHHQRPLRRLPPETMVGPARLFVRCGFCPEINSLAGELGAPFRNTNARPCGRTCVPQHWNARKNPQETEHSRDFFDILDLLTAADLSWSPHATQAVGGAVATKWISLRA